MNKPLYTYYHPKKLDEYIGQEHIVGPDKIINRLIETKKPVSLLLYGKPGIGKTTLARLIVDELGATCVRFNAANENKKALEDAIAQIKDADIPYLIIDEIHSLNKTKQDFLLQSLEEGEIFVIGTTTQNPYFHVNEALRSRLTTLELKPYSHKTLHKYIDDLIESQEYLFNDDERDAILVKSGGDIRTIINMCEVLNPLDDVERMNILMEFQANYKTNSTDYYDIVSAFQKSIRGSDVDAALIYLSLLLANGHLEEVCRRIAVISYEDIGFGNINAITRTKDAIEMAKQVGMPEAIYPLGFATIDLALSPKSRIVGQSMGRAMSAIDDNADLVIPEFIKYKNKHLYAEHYRAPLEHKVSYKPEGVDQFIMDFSFVSNTKYEEYLHKQYLELKELR